MSRSVSPRAGRSYQERCHTDQCEHPIRYPDEPAGYLAWHEWAEEKSKTHHQVRCEHCGLFSIWEPNE